MYEYLDKYCERIHPQWWSEPFNIVSNLAFIIVALLLLRLYIKGQPSKKIIHNEEVQAQKRLTARWDLQILLLLIFIIGVGSALWHITALYWALLMDQVPILLFINVYLLSCLYRIFRIPPLKILAIFAAYQLFNIGLQLALPAEFLNGSIFYLPTLVFLFILTFASRQIQSNYYKAFLGSSIIFTVALVFRTLDLDICARMSSGTHFIWHILIALTIFILMRLLLQSHLRPN